MRTEQQGKFLLIGGNSFQSIENALEKHLQRGWKICYYIAGCLNKALIGIDNSWYTIAQQILRSYSVVAVINFTLVVFHFIFFTA